MRTRLSIEDSYKILGLPDEATYEQAKAAYRELMKGFHPDRFSGNPHQKAFAENAAKNFNEAWRVLRLHLGTKGLSEASEDRSEATHHQASQKSQNWADARERAEYERMQEEEHQARERRKANEERSAQERQRAHEHWCREEELRKDRARAAAEKSRLDREAVEQEKLRRVFDENEAPRKKRTKFLWASAAVFLWVSAAVVFFVLWNTKHYLSSLHLPAGTKSQQYPRSALGHRATVNADTRAGTNEMTQASSTEPISQAQPLQTTTTSTAVTGVDPSTTNSLTEPQENSTHELALPLGAAGEAPEIVAQGEREAWEAAASARTESALDRFLQAHPTGRFAAAARSLLDQLRSEQQRIEEGKGVTPENRKLVGSFMVHDRGGQSQNPAARADTSMAAPASSCDPSIYGIGFRAGSRGLEVACVDQQSKALGLRLQPSDVFLSFNGRRMESPEMLVNALRSFASQPPGYAFYKVLRNGQVIDYNLDNRRDLEPNR